MHVRPSRLKVWKDLSVSTLLHTLNILLDLTNYHLESRKVELEDPESGGYMVAPALGKQSWSTAWKGLKTCGFPETTYAGLMGTKDSQQSASMISEEIVANFDGYCASLTDTQSESKLKEVTSSGYQEGSISPVQFRPRKPITLPMRRLISSLEGSPASSTPTVLDGITYSNLCELDDWLNDYY